MNLVETLHRFVGYSVPTGFALLALWAVYSLIRNEEPPAHYWNLLAALQVVIGIQVIVGGTLFLAGRRPASNGPSWLHYVYGAAFPALILTLAHLYARRAKAGPWLIFGIAALICFGLTFRALQTGLGID